MGETCVQVSGFCNLVTHTHWDDSYHLWYNPFKQESMLLDKGKSHHIETRKYRNSVYQRYIAGLRKVSKFLPRMI